MCECTLSCLTLHNHGLQPTRLLYAWDSPGKNTRVGCHAPPQRTFPTQGSNLHLLGPCTAGRSFTTSVSWEAPLSAPFGKSPSSTSLKPVTDLNLFVPPATCLLLSYKLLLFQSSLCCLLCPELSSPEPFRLMKIHIC